MVTSSSNNPMLWHDLNLGISFEAETKEADEKSGLHLPSGVNASNLIEFLSRDPEIQACYAKDAGVSEGYTVGQHTQMVLDIAAKYKSSFERQVSKVATWEEFLLFLALHDIGKGLAKDKQTAFDSSVSFKSSELSHTQDLMRKIMAKHGVAPEKIAVFCAMLTFDTQGLFLKEEISENEAFDNILEMSRNCSLDPIQFYGIFSAFHAVDAASYPSLSSLFDMQDGRLRFVLPAHQQKVEELTQHLQQVAEGRERFSNLQKKLYAGKVEEAKQYFLRSLPELTQFLCSVHKEMLALTDKPQAPHAREKFREIKRTFRDLFVAVAANSSKLEEIQQKYPRALQKDFGKRAKSASYVHDFAAMFFSRDWDGSTPLKYFLDELIQFRRNYLCRYSIEKVMALTAQTLNWFQSVSKEKTDPISLPKDFAGLMQATYIHGTHAAIMPNLVRTGMSLMSSGRLAKTRIVLFSGEHQGGATASGRNQYYISGTTLVDAGRAVSYSERSLPNISNDEDSVMQFLKDIERTNSEGEFFETSSNLASGGKSFVYISSQLLRWRCNNSSTYEPVRSKLEKMVGGLDDSFQKFKRSKDYQRMMPHEWDPTGKLGYMNDNDYWYKKFTDCEAGIKSLKQAVTDEVAPIKGMKEAIENPYPLVFVSKTIHTMNPDWDECSERLCQKAALLGKEIQMIYTKPKNREHAVQFFNSHGLKGRITYGDIEDIKKAEFINELISGYLNDFASSRKIARLGRTEIWNV